MPDVLLCEDEQKKSTERSRNDRARAGVFNDERAIAVTQGGFMSNHIFLIDFWFVSMHFSLDGIPRLINLHTS